MKLKIAQILLEESKFAHRAGFLTQLPTSTPESTASVNIRVDLQLAENGPGALVRLFLETQDDGTAPYLFTVSYLVLFAFEEDETPAPPDLERRLIVTGATMAYPFARECLANLSSRGRFGPTWLLPMDFNQFGIEHVAAPIGATNE